MIALDFIAVQAAMALAWPHSSACSFLQTARFEAEVVEAEAAAGELRERLREALRQAREAAGEAEAAREAATESQVGDEIPGAPYSTNDQQQQQ